MANVIVSPSEQRRFADFLKDRTSRLMRKQRDFITMLNDAKAVCRDQKYADFRKRTEEVAKLLEDFNRQADRFADFLHKKAAAGERFLRG